MSQQSSMSWNRLYGSPIEQKIWDFWLLLPDDFAIIERYVN